jgi:hypothetical protein
MKFTAKAPEHVSIEIREKDGAAYYNEFIK